MIDTDTFFSAASTQERRWRMIAAEMAPLNLRNDTGLLEVSLQLANGTSSNASHALLGTKQRFAQRGAATFPDLIIGTPGIRDWTTVNPSTHGIKL